jgi:hypothetical protein
VPSHCRRLQMNEYFQQVSSGYDTLADEYTARLSHELEYKPLDRDWLTHFAAAVGSPGPIWDAGRAMWLAIFMSRALMSWG